jgi:ABC-type transport system involved in multi-copper enzyme maturation permease subunit
MSGGVPFRALLRSEWTKLRSIRSTWWCTAVYLLVVGGAGWLAAASTNTAPRSDVALGAALTGFGVGQLVVLVLGVLAVTTEFASGMVLASLTVAPRRTRLLLAKTLVVTLYCALLTAVLTVVCAAAAFTLTDVPGGFALTGAEVLRPMGLQIVHGALVAVLAVALGALVRSTAGAVGIGAALVFVLPPALALWGEELALRASQALPALRVGEDAFAAVATTWPVGMAIVAGWAAVAWLLGAVLLERRDV